MRIVLLTSTRSIGTPAPSVREDAFLAGVAAHAVVSAYLNAPGRYVIGHRDVG
jgi:hypothetical protein